MGTRPTGTAAATRVQLGGRVIWPSHRKSPSRTASPDFKTLNPLHVFHERRSAELQAGVRSPGLRVEAEFGLTRCTGRWAYWLGQSQEFKSRLSHFPV